MPALLDNPHPHFDNTPRRLIASFSPSSGNGCSLRRFPCAHLYFYRYLNGHNGLTDKLQAGRFFATRMIRKFSVSQREG